MASKWKILVVDDDKAVHEATEFALGEEVICGRPLKFLHAFSANEARTTMGGEIDVAVIFLDVVMESSQAGLDLVEEIRANPGYQHTRIIVRTGQPGLAPEREVMQQYQIDDYRPKSELTLDHLITTLTSSIRAYSHSCQIDRRAYGLEQILMATPSLIKIQSMRHFGEGILTQLAALVGTAPSGFLLIDKKPSEDGREMGDGSVVAACGNYEGLAGSNWQDLDREIARNSRFFLQRGKHDFTEDRIILVIAIDEKMDVLVFLERRSENASLALDERVLEIFANNVGLGFKNLWLFEQLHHLIEVDTATGLPSKSSLFEKTQMLLDQHQGQVAVAAVELPEWDLISTGISPEAADRALLGLADWLKNHLPEESLVARVGDNRLGIALRDSGRALEKLVAKAGNGVAIPIGSENAHLPVQLKIGWSVGKSEDRAEALWREAALALRETKQHGCSHFVKYRDDISQRVNQRIKVSRQLSEALQLEKGLTLQYQPVRDLRKDVWVGAEALCRWRLTDGTHMLPHTFIPVAETTGQIFSLGRWVLHQVCQLSVKWCESITPAPVLAVNVSPQQLQWTGFIKEVTEILRETGADPSFIELEITESTRIDDMESTALVLSELRKIGFRIALDDFGTGFASLTNLLLLPLDTIKIDRVVTEGIDRGGRHFFLAKAIVQLAHDAGLVVTAEGVERESQERILREIGCNRAQGYFYAKPTSQSKFEQMYRDCIEKRAFKTTAMDCNHWPKTSVGQWEIMLIDEDSEMHDKFVCVLEGKPLFGAPIRIIHEHSVSNAYLHLAKKNLPVVIFLELPAAAPMAGLEFLHELSARSDFYRTQVVVYSNNSETGTNDSETGTASLIEGYDIYASVSKEELSANRLHDMVRGAIRTYDKALDSQRTAAELVRNRRQLDLLGTRLNDRIRREAHLRKEIDIDTLTGVSSRALMEKALENEFSSMLRSKAPLAFLLIDIDQFKKYNDAYGHLAGDRCLRLVAQTLKACCKRITDVCARYGGEEFAIIAPHTDSKGSNYLARKVVETIRSLEEPHPGNSSKKVTVSVGVVSRVPQNGGDYWDLVHLADEALYQAKASGRNQFRVHA